MIKEENSRMRMKIRHFEQENARKNQKFQQLNETNTVRFKNDSFGLFHCVVLEYIPGRIRSANIVLVVDGSADKSNQSINEQTARARRCVVFQAIRDKWERRLFELKLQLKDKDKTIE
jgi:hypothetical protein